MANEPDIGRLTLQDDDDVQKLFNTPVKGNATRPSIQAPSKKDDRVATEQPQAHESRSEAQRSGDSTAGHEDRLRAELAQLRSINGTLEGLNASLSKSKTNLQTMQHNMNSTKALLKTWSRILSQAEHNQRLLLDPDWQGATKDVEDIQTEELHQQQEAERKIQEETRRKEEAEEKTRREEARKLQDLDKRPSRGLTRTRSTRASGARTASTRSQIGTATRGRATTRGGSGIARGSATAHDRGRG